MKTMFFLLLIFYELSSVGQLDNDLLLLKSAHCIIPETNTKNIQFQNADSSQNRNRTFLKLSFRFYKNFLSSQDINSCNFSPSCSEYAVIAIKEQGLLGGTINFIDRFTRCNGMNAGQYNVTEDKQLLYDPVRNFRYEILHEE